MIYFKSGVYPLGLLEISNSTNGILTIVFASLFLVSIGVLTHNAFADQVVTTIPFGNQLMANVGANPNTDKIYVTSPTFSFSVPSYTQDNNKVFVINGSTDTVLGNVTVGTSYYTSATDVGVNPITGRIYVTNWSSSGGVVSVINGTTDKVIDTISSVGDPDRIAVNPSTNMIYVSDTGLHNLYVINGATDTVVNAIKLGGEPRGVAVNPNTNKIYVDLFLNDTVSVINGSTNSVIGAIPVGSDPQGIAVNPSTDKVYATNEQSNTVSVIDGSTNTVTKTMPVGNGPDGIAANPSTNKIYVTNSGGNTVSVMDGLTDSVVSTLPVGSEPVGVGVNPSTDKIYVANYRDCSSNPCQSSVTVISGSSSSGTSSNATAPSTPQNLAAITVSSSQINLSWNAPSSNGGSIITGYKIERMQGSSITWSTIVSNTSSTATTYSDTGLAASTSYTYRVSAINSVGTSFPSSTATATTLNPVTVPAAPISLTATAGNAQVTLSWAAPSSNGGSAITNYTVYRGTSSGNETFLATNGTATSYTDKAVAKGQTYYYKVTAVNSFGESPPSNETDTIPSPPFNFEAHSMTGYVLLTWEVPTYQGSSITNYKIFKGTSSGSESLLATVGNGNSYTDKAIINGTVYYYRATAVNWFSESQPSAESSAIPSAYTNPSAPTNLAATADNGQILLSWSAPSSNGGAAITNYYIGRGTSSGQESLLASVSGNTTTFTDANLAYGVTYYYYVVATNSAGDSSPMSNEASATPSAPATVPSVPTNLGANAVSSSQITLSWNEPSSNGGSAITGYEIERMQGSSTTWTTIISNTGSMATTYSDTGLAASTSYTYRVSAINSVGTSSASSTATATTLNPVTVPAAPASLTATAGNAHVTLSWAAPSNNGGSAITNYTVYRGTSSGNETFLIHIGNVTSFNDVRVTQGQTYYYKVAAVNWAGTSLKSNEASATPVSVPQPPTNLAATAASSSLVNLIWTAPANNGGSSITGYMIQRSTDGGSTWSTVISDTNYTSTIYNDAGLSPNTTYAYQVAAINSVGTSVTSNTASATTLAAVPSSPTGLTATGVSPKEINLSWNTPTNNGGTSITSYKIMISTNGSSFTALVNDTNSTATAYSASGLHPHTIYYFEVSAINSVGTSALSNVASAATR